MLRGGSSVAKSGGVRDLVVAARREQILRAATRVFAEKGFSRATTREVAREAGISEGTIYNYFEDKYALLMATMDVLNETERRAGDFEASLAENFEDFVEAYLHHRMAVIWDNREVFRVVLSEMLVNARLRERYMREVVEPTMEIGEENFRERIKQGKARATDVALATRAGAAAVLGLLVLGLLGDEEVGARWDEAAGVLSGMLLHGLEKSGAGRHA